MNGHTLARFFVGFIELSSLVEAWAPFFVAAVVVTGLIAVVVAHFVRGGRPGH